MAKGDIETYYEDGQWKSKVEGRERAARVGGTKAEQTAIGRRLAQDHKGEHIIKNEDGTIGEKNSYGKRPHPPKG